MAENQTATEDSGQQSTQHQTHPHHNQQHQQQQHSHNDNSQTLSTQNSEDLSSAPTSPTTPPNENNSASSPDEPQTVVVANHHHQTHQQQQQEPHQQQERSMIDRQVTTKIKAIRRNTIQTTSVPVRATSTTSIKKPSLIKMNSLTGTTGNGEKNNTDKNHLQQQQQQHHHHHHQHNSMTNHHHHHQHQRNNSASSTGTNSNSTAIHRTTSESLRLNALPPNGGGGNAASNTGRGDTLSNATSNSSIHSNLTNNSSSSASVAPKSTSTTASHSKSTTSKSSTASSKASSPNNNNSIASVAGGSSHTSRSHHSHGHIQGHGHGHTAAGSRKPKTTSSFQITSVTVGHPKAPVAPDNGEEESADDLDESHTDDNSRITDLENETPSMSEDTFSKEEIYYHQDDALSSTAPVIPTSSQYGLVVATLGAQDISNVQVNVGENFINVVPSGSGIKKEDLKDSSQHRSERFKVVKIESTEPFRRGRWVCMDYLDHSSVSGKEDSSGGAGNNNEKTEAGGGVDNSEHAAPKTTQSMILGPSAAAALENHVDPSTVPAADGNWNFTDTNVNVGGGGGGIATAPASVVHGIQQYVETSEGTDQQKQILPQEPQYQTPPQEVNANATQQMTMTAQAPPEVMQPAVPMDYATVAAQKLKKSLEELKKQEEAIAASEKAAAAAGGVYMPGQSQPINFEAMQQQQQVTMQQSQQVAMQQQQQQHASTLPGNISMQNGNISIATDNSNVNVAQQTQQQQQMMVEPQQTQSLGYAVEASQQQPMSPAPQQMQVPPNFVTASFQGTPQQTPPQQSPQMQDAGQAMQHHQQHMNQQQITQQQQLQQALPQQQQQPPTTQLQQQTSQTDGVTNLQNVAAVACIQQMQHQQQQQSHAQAAQQQPQLPPQFQQLQQQQQPLAPGQTMPILTQMTNYDMQQQQQQQQHHLQQQQSAPASMMDNSALLATLQAQQQQQQQHQQSTATNTLSGPTNMIMQTASVNAPSQYQQQPQQQQSQLPIDSAPTTSVSANSSNSTVNLNPITTATIIPITSSNNSLPVGTNVASSNNNNTTTNIDNQIVLQQQQQQQQQMQPPQQPSTSSQLQTTQQQLLQNTETETESNVSRLTQAMSTNNKMHHRKRAFSSPFITPYEQQMLSGTGSELPQVLLMPSSMGGNNDQNVYFYNKTPSGRSSFCVDESMWPGGQVPRFINVSGNNNPPLLTQLGSDSNIYTNLALGNERYKLPVEFLTSLSPGVSITTSSTQREGDDDDELEDLINENDEDLEESVDQFSPLLYPNTQQQQRSQPIAISAGNSPVHMPKTATLASGQKSPMRVASPTAGHYQHHLAFSASPTARPYPYLPFYASSPDTRQNQTTPQNKAAYSYDPSFGANISRLTLPLGQQQQQQQSSQQAQPKQLPRQPPFPQQRHSQPSTSASHFTSPIQPTQNLSTASIESAPGAIIFATSPTSSLTNSASGTSAVAIDNKIEQAMDLVKSHLMIAVREEVEVLKEKISELMDKINQLEVENTILKANMSQETLQQLQMQTQLQIAGSTPTNGSNMLTAAPSPAAITAAPTPVASAATAASAVAANTNIQNNTAATPQSNVGSGTATPTTQQSVEQNVEVTQTVNAVNAEDNQGSVQAANGPMS